MLPSNIDIDTEEVFTECLFSKEKKYALKIIKKNLMSLLYDGIGSFRFLCGNYVTSNLKDVKGKNAQNTNNSVHIDGWSCRVCPIVNNSGISISLDEFVNIINIAVYDINSGKYKAESLLFIYLYLKYINYFSNKGNLNNAFEVSYRTIGSHTGISYYSIKKYIECLERNHMLYSFWLGNYHVNKNGVDVIHAAPTLYTFKKNYGAMIRKIYELQDTISSNSDSKGNTENIFFSNSGELFEIWKEEKKKGIV